AGAGARRARWSLVLAPGCRWRNSGLSPRGHPGGALLSPTTEQPKQSLWEWAMGSHHMWFGLVVAVGGAAAGLAFRMAVAPWLDERVAFLFFVPAVVAAAALGGVLPGVVATVLGALGGLWVTWQSAERTAGDLVA